jgi:uncharacterized membrane protein YdjX (TVP38/TMEM64 family)
LIHEKYKLPLDIVFQLFLAGIASFLLFTYLPTIVPVYKSIFVLMIIGIALIDIFFIVFKKVEYLKITKLVLMFICILIFITFIIFYITKFTVLTDVYGFEYVLTQNKSAAKLIFFLICFSQPIILPIPEAVTIPAGSAVFGPFAATLLGFCGTILGIIVMFFLARIGGKKLITKFIKEKHLNKYQEYVGKNETTILALLFIIPILPDEIICVGAGIGGVSFKRFLIIASVSKLLTSTLLAYSLHLAKLLPLTGSQFVLAGSVILAIVFVTTLIIKRILKKSKTQVNLTE